MTFDDDYKDFPTPNSEDLAPPSSDNEYLLDSAEFDGASNIGSYKFKSLPEYKGHPEMTKQPEEQSQKIRKRLRMLDKDADGVRIKMILDFKKAISYMHDCDSTVAK